MLIMFGSSVFFVLLTEHLIRPQRFWTSNFLTSGTHALLGGMSTAGSLTRWFRDQLGQPELVAEAAGADNAYAALALLAAGSPPGAAGLVALPYFAGERTPIHDPGATGVLFGLRLTHTRADIYRAILESVAYGIRHNLEAMAEEGVRASRILAVGGGTKNRLWMQIVADVCGIKMAIPAQQIGASYGDAFMAGVGTGLFGELSDIRSWVTIRETVVPDPATRKVYDRNYEIYRALYEQTAGLMHALSDGAV
jgi:xylulokinase